MKYRIIIALLITIQSVSYSLDNFDVKRIKNLNDIGTVYFENKDYTRAINKFETAYKIDQENTVLKANLINSYLGQIIHLKRKGRLKKAITLSKKAIQINDTVPSSHILLASIYMDNGNYIPAQGELEIANIYSPDNPVIINMLGETYFQQGDLKNALKYWKQIKEKSPYNEPLKRKIIRAKNEWQVQKSFKEISSHPFKLKYKFSNEYLANRVMEALKKAHQNIGKKFKCFPFSEIITILYNPDEFKKATDSDGFIAGLYDGKIRIKVSHKLINDKEFLEKIIYHEYTHVLIRYLTNDRCPFWLNEGLAQSFSEPITSINIDILTNLELESSIFHLSKMERVQGFTKGPDYNINLNTSITLAYIKSVITTTHIINTFGLESCLKILTDLKNKKTVTESVENNLGISIDELDKQIQAKISQCKETLLNLVRIEK